MTTLTIKISDDLKDFLDEEISAGEYATPSHFISDMLKKKKLEKLLVDRMGEVARGDSEELKNADWNHLREDLIKYHKGQVQNGKPKRALRTHLANRPMIASSTRTTRPIPKPTQQ